MRESQHLSVLADYEKKFINVCCTLGTLII